jgi:catechol 2,3-dioxygenase-like lactoylglutathione lyase family enzyme
MISGFASVSVWVKDFEQAIHFYRDVLELEMVSRPGEIPQFKVGGGFLVLAKGNFCPPADSFPPDFPQLGLETDDLARMAARLQQAGVELGGSMEERRDSRWLNVCDPDGNLIELVQVLK